MSWFLIADLEDLEKKDASDINPRRIKAKDVLISHKDDELVFLFADGTAKNFQEENTNFENPLSGGNNM